MPDDWKNQKPELEEMAKDPSKRGQVFKQLFESESQYRQVSNFLSEYLVKVFPSDFMTGKNKKSLDKKLLSFVKYNRFETFTKITLLDGMDVDKVKWLNYGSK